jgi:DNA-binding beta-propeller fold protein YncE
MKTTIAALLLAFALASTPCVAQDPLTLPVIGAVPVDTMLVDSSGIRGLAFSRAGVWILTSDHLGRSVADSSYTSTILSWDPSTGEVREFLRERDSFGTGLAWDGESLWAGGNRVGGLEAIYRIDPNRGLAEETIPSSGYHPGGLAWGADYLWQVDSSARQVSRIETEEGKLSRRLQPPGFYPTGLAHDGVHLYCADAATGMVYRMNARSGRADGVLDPEVVRFTGEFVTLAWEGNTLWTVRDTDRFVVRYQLLP